MTNPPEVLLLAETAQGQESIDLNNRLTVMATTFK